MIIVSWFVVMNTLSVFPIPELTGSAVTVAPSVTLVSFLLYRLLDIAVDDTHTLPFDRGCLIFVNLSAQYVYLCIIGMMGDYWNIWRLE